MMSYYFTVFVIMQQLPIRIPYVCANMLGNEPFVTCWCPGSMRMSAFSSTHSEHGYRLTYFFFSRASKVIQLKHYKKSKSVYA